MSNMVSSYAQRRVVGSPMKKAILMYMADRASDDGSGIWSSKTAMAADLETTRRTVQRKIDELIDEGVIFEVGQKPCKNGFTVEYCISMEALSHLPKTRDTQTPVTHDHPYPRHTTTPTRDTVSHKPSIEPPLEPSLFEDRENQGGVPASRKKRACTLPENWVPSDRNVKDAIKLNFSQQEIDHEAFKFLNHATANARKQIDWDASWRSWLANAVERRGRSTSGAARPNGHGQESGIVGAVMRRRASG